VVVANLLSKHLICYGLENWHFNNYADVNFSLKNAGQYCLRSNVKIKSYIQLRLGVDITYIDWASLPTLQEKFAT